MRQDDGGGDKAPTILPLDGEGGLPRSGKTEGVNPTIRRINLAPTAGYPRGLRRAEQSPSRGRIAFVVRLRGRPLTRRIRATLSRKGRGS
jgi:hypothetical protein